MGDVGPVATFLDDLLRFFAIDPDGFTRMSTEHKLEALHDAATRAVGSKDWDAVDRCVAAYRELRRKTT